MTDKNRVEVEKDAEAQDETGKVLAQIRNFAAAAGMSDTDVWSAWHMGLVVFQKLRTWGVKFPHDALEKGSKG